jgi:hypothetical protein
MTTSLSPADQRMAAAFSNFIDLGYVLMSDIMELTETESESRSQSWRRNYIRASIALVEGFGHCLREICAVGCSACSTPSISPKEHQVLNAENDFDTGERIKLTLRVAYKLFELQPAPNFAGREWTQARWALRRGIDSCTRRLQLTWIFPMNFGSISMTLRAG